MAFTRRNLLAAAPAATAITVSGPSMAQSQLSAQQVSLSRQAPGFYRYKVGDIEVTAVHDGFARSPLEGFVRNAELADVLTHAMPPNNLTGMTPEERQTVAAWLSTLKR